MKSIRMLLALVLFSALFVGLSISPAYAVNKDMVELQTQITALQQQMTQMKQSFDERMGVMQQSERRDQQPAGFDQ